MHTKNVKFKYYDLAIVSSEHVNSPFTKAADILKSIHDLDINSRKHQLPGQRAFFLQSLDVDNESGVATGTFAVTKDSERAPYISLNDLNEERPNQRKAHEQEKGTVYFSIRTTPQHATLILQSRQYGITHNNFREYITHFLRQMDIPEHDHVILCRPIISTDFIPILRSMHRAVSLQLTIIRSQAQDVYDELPDLGPEAQDPFTINYKAKRGHSISNSIEKVYKEYQNNKINRILVDGFTDQNSSIRIDTSGSELTASMNVHIDENKICDHQEMIAHAKSLAATLKLN